MRILLLSNYLPDAQESMLRFSTMLRQGLLAHGHYVEVAQPYPLFGKIPIAGRSKWLRYIDKYILFPKYLRKIINDFDIIHVCDHSNAVYMPLISNMSHVVTCHDLLAVRGAMGEETCCPASPLGKILQDRILQGLRQSKSIVCVSKYTYKDVSRLVLSNSNVLADVIYNGLNYRYSQLPLELVNQRLEENGLQLNCPYILHVGSNHKRKNREGILRIFNHLKNEWQGKIVFAGQELSSSQLELGENLGVMNRVVEVKNPSNEVLEALYNKAFAFLFPSYSEGFGWPIIEAQACGCVVVCSDQCSLPEVAGDGAIIVPINNESEFAQALLSLQDLGNRKYWSQKGLINSERFHPELMIQRYIGFYSRICQQDR